MIAKASKFRKFFLFSAYTIIIFCIVSCSPFIDDDQNFEENGPHENTVCMLNFYYDGNLILQKEVKIGAIVGNVEIPDINTEQFSVQWYANYPNAGSPIYLEEYILTDCTSEYFFATITPKYLNITIEYNNGDPPKHETIYDPKFYHPNPVFKNYEIVPGRFIDLEFEGWYVEGEKINAYTNRPILSKDCVVEAGWKLPRTSNSTTWESISVTIPHYISAIDNSIFENWHELKEVRFADNSFLRTIGSKAFSNTKKLTEIIIPDSVTRIEDFAFKGSSIKSCEISNLSKLEFIGKQAFYQTKLESINLPNNLNTIEEEAFCASFNLENIIIDGDHSKLRKIGKYAFSDTAISSFTIPPNVSQISGGAFSACSSLTQLFVNPLNEHFSSKEGVLFQGNTLIAWPDGKKPVVIPEGTREIFEYTFGFSRIENIVLPRTLFKIGEGAFEQTFFLLEVTIPDSVEFIDSLAFYLSFLENCSIGQDSELSHIGDKAFYGTKMQEFWMPPRIKIVGKDAFWSRNLRLVGFHEGIKTIGDYFSTVPTGKSSIIIPDSVTAIVSNAFYSGTKLFTNKTSLSELSEYGLSEKQIARYSWFNTTTGLALE